MIKTKSVDAERRGIWCPMRGTEGRCIGQACAWWVDEDDERGHCAVLDAGGRTEATPDGR